MLSMLPPPDVPLPPYTLAAFSFLSPSPTLCSQCFLLPTFLFRPMLSALPPPNVPLPPYALDASRSTLRSRRCFLLMFLPAYALNASSSQHFHSHPMLSLFPPGVPFPPYAIALSTFSSSQRSFSTPCHCLDFTFIFHTMLSSFIKLYAPNVHPPNVHLPPHVLKQNLSALHVRGV